MLSRSAQERQLRTKRELASRAVSRALGRISLADEHEEKVVMVRLSLSRNIGFARICRSTRFRSASPAL